MAVIAAFGALTALLLVWFEQTAEREDEATGRDQSAAKMLGEVDARVAAIDLLEGIARDDSRYRGPAVQLLNAYVRAHSPWPPRNAVRLAPSSEFIPACCNKLEVII